MFVKIHYDALLDPSPWSGGGRTPWGASASPGGDGPPGAAESTPALSALDTQSYSLTCTAPDPPPADSGTEGSTTP